MHNAGEPIPRLPIIGVMGSGHSIDGAGLAEFAGHLVARKGCHLLTGGGPGLMTVTARAFAETPERKGLSIGILPATHFGSGESPEGYPNDWIEVPIRTQLTRGVSPRGLRSRNTVNVLTAAALIFLPGGRGTFSELRLARRYDRPRVLFLGPSGTIDGKDASALRNFAPAAASEADIERFLDNVTTEGGRIGFRD